MTTIPNFIRTTTQIRLGVNTTLSISYDCTGLGTWMPMQEKLQSLTDQAIEQWWNGLTSFQKSAARERGLSLRISAHSQSLPRS